MTLDTSKPEDTRMVNELPGYIRENRVAINAISGGGDVGATVVTIPGGTTQLTVGTELGLYGFESVIITGAAISTLTHILNGVAGQIKCFIFQDTNVRMTDGNVKANGLLYLNIAPAGSTYAPAQDDVIMLMNIGGDGGATNHGYWKEIAHHADV